LLALLGIAGTPLGAQSTGDAGAPVPDWHVAHLEYMSRGSGQWVADNAAYRSDAEPATEYILEFGLSFDGASMFGRLYAQVNGQRGVTLWEYRTHWDAGAAATMVEQVGWESASGRGELQPAGDDAFHLEQVVVTPGLPSRVEGHRLTILDANTHRTEAYGLDANGARVPTRTYTWVRQPVL
jgi:hypothetical protein